jgi:hypothetical protein
MISKIVLLNRASKAAFACLLVFLVGCASSATPKGETVIIGKAVDSKNGQALVGKPIKLLDIRTHPSPFGITAPREIGKGTTGAGGRFAIVVPGNYKDEWVDIRFVGESVPYEGSRSSSATWRIVDVSVDSAPSR